MSPVPPPPPGGVAIPEPPYFGWLGDPAHITPNELDEIQRAAGVPFGSIPHMALPAWVAVAYARRVDPDRYPWAVALSLPMSVIDTSAEERQEQEAEEYAQAVEHALDTGQDPPADPS